MAPEFTALPSPIRLEDSAPIGKQITTLTAIDGDASPPFNQVSPGKTFSL